MSPGSGGPTGGAMSDDGACRGLGSSLECKPSQNLSALWRHTHQMAVLLGPGKIHFQILVDIGEPVNHIHFSDNPT